MIAVGNESFGKAGHSLNYFAFTIFRTFSIRLEFSSTGLVADQLMIFWVHKLSLICSDQRKKICSNKPILYLFMLNKREHSTFAYFVPVTEDFVSNQ